MKYKKGDQVRLKQDSSHYTGRYAGTLVTIDVLDNSNHCTVVGFDGKKFLCPYSYFFDDDDFWTFDSPDKDCVCGATKVYGDNIPAYYHYDFCPLYRPRKEE